MGRPTKGASRLKKYRSQETGADKTNRLRKNAVRISISRSCETVKDRKERLLAMQNYMKLRSRQETLEQYESRLSKIQERLASETSEQHAHRLGLIYDRLANESAEQRAHRLGLINERLVNESAEQRVHRLGVINKRLANESAEQRAHRLGVINERLANESAEQKAHRLGVINERLASESDEQRAHRLDVINKRLASETAEQRAHRLRIINERLSNESAEQRAHRLGLVYDRLANESAEERAHRLEVIKNRRAAESTQQRENRLATARQTSQRLRSMIERNFLNTINQYAEIPCTVCKKLLYPKQRMSIFPARFTFLPQELVACEKIITCSRCSTTIKKRKVPSQAYWNNMEVMSMPPELSDLTDVEQRLLSRIVPFIKIVKLHNRFSQSWSRGQVILFAQDVIEVAEQLPLPLTQAGIVFVVETRENLPNHKQFQVNLQKIKYALNWLLKNNHLYRDVRPNFSNIAKNCDISQIIEVSEKNQDELNNSQSPDADANHNIAKYSQQFNSKYISINNNISILRGSFHQGSDRLESSGRQCTAIAAVACIACYRSDPSTWTVSDLDYILIVGDRFYRQCLRARPVPDPNEINSDYLAATELLSQVTFQSSCVNLNVANDLAINGHFLREQEGFPNLENGIAAFFDNYSSGILTANFISVCISFKNQSYWLIDSHARGPKGHKGRTGGVSCCMRFENSQQIAALLRSNLKATGLPEYMLNIYSITPVFVVDIGGHSSIESHISSTNLLASNLRTENGCDIEELSSRSASVVNNIEIVNKQGEDRRLILSTSLLYNIDENIPNLDSIIESDTRNPNLTANRVTNIHRKTAPPVNIERERRMEELCWYTMYPNGRNGFGEPRNVPITALDYFQARVMSNEARFQKVDYLFFALSVVEYYRAKASVSVSCRMRQGQNILAPQGLVDNIHLTMRNIRGSASYWKRCCAELIAMVRSLGAPTWFATFSCNDLNWPDMLKALLIADGRKEFDIEALTFQERLELVQKYPVVIARQFTLRVNALIAFIKKNNECFGGPIIDFWYRIEFQNRGSPHLHMLLWCDLVPNFHSTEGLRVINKVVSCSVECELSDLVTRLQTHRHSATCYKDRNNRSCRFGFPRPISDETKCLGPDETLANQGRFCVLKRNELEVMINNYNSSLLELWQANMDVQPCGNVTAVAYYIAKYASKCEPSDCGDVVREAVQKAKRHTNDVWKQLFAVSMAILSQRLVSAPEAAYRLCHLPLKFCTRKAVFVNSCMPDQRYRLLRFDSDETSVFNNIFDRYQLRPDNLEEISLAEFAVRYENVSSCTWIDDDNGDSELREQEPEVLRYITLRDNTRMRIRNKVAVLRHRYFTLNSDRNGFYYNLIVLHLPFRNENELLGVDETPEACFLRRHTELRPLNPNQSVEQFAHAEIVIQQALAQAVAFNVVNSPTNEVTIPRQPLDIYANDQLDFYEDDDDLEDLNNHAIMSDAFFSDGIRKLNIEQKDLMKRVTDSIKNNIQNNENYEPLLLFITGGAGSGKSFLLKLIVEHVRRCYAPTVDSLLQPIFVEVASLTGVAARQIGGRTLHSVFSLPIEKGNTVSFRKMTGDRLERERRKWRFIQWLVIDEISMVSYQSFRHIHLRLQEYKNNSFLFGGINVLLFGDIMQLPPVKGHWCFEQPPWLSAEVHLWRQFSFCELTMNMRQSSDTEFVDLLNNLRFGELTAAQLEILCEKRRVNLTGDFADGAAVRIFPTIRLVEEYNSRMTEVIARECRIYTVNAMDESREAATYGKRPPDNVIPVDANNCGGLLHNIKIGVGSRVMLRRNMAVSDGLVNGAMGVIMKIKWPALRRDQMEAGELPEAVLIKFDDQTIGTRVKDAEGLVSIAPTSATFQANKGYGDVERLMLPLILSWAVTVHKLQGTTLERAVIDLGKKNFAKGQVYVALSRVKSLDGVALCDLEPSKLLQRPHDNKALEEMHRLRQLN